jgi:hypothetical protein
MKVLAKVEKLEKQAALTTTSMRDDIRSITELNTKHTDELSKKFSTHFHLSELRTNTSASARQELGSKVEKVTKQVSDSTGQQDPLLILVREMTESAAQKEREHQQQIAQFQLEQWSNSAKEIHRGHTVLRTATVRRHDALSAQVLALVQAVSALTVSADDLATRRAQEQLLQPAARTMEVKKPEQNKMVVQMSGGQLRMDHSSLVSDLGITGGERKSDRIKIEILAQVVHKSCARRRDFMDCAGLSTCKRWRISTGMIVRLDLPKSGPTTCAMTLLTVLRQARNHLRRSRSLARRQLSRSRRRSSPQAWQLGRTRSSLPLSRGPWAAATQSPAATPCSPLPAHCLSSCFCSAHGWPRAHEQQAQALGPAFSHFSGHKQARSKSIG